MALSCGTDAPPPDASSEAPESEAAEEPSFQGREYQRYVAFLTTGGDSTLVVPWYFSSQAFPGGVRREIRGWLARGGSWEAFHDAAWETPPSRAPWRIIPHGPVRLIMGIGEVLDGIVYAAGARHLEVAPGELLVEWRGPRGETYRVQDGAAMLSNQRVEGMVVDLTRARGADEPVPGDWVFLVSGDSLQLFLDSPDGTVTGVEQEYRGWARLDFRQLQWPRVLVTWQEVRAFEPARRDVPATWVFRSADDGLEGSFTISSSHMEVGPGEGPLLPVEAFFEVEGTVRMEGRELPVRGLLRHIQPTTP